MLAGIVEGGKVFSQTQRNRSNVGVRADGRRRKKEANEGAWALRGMMKKVKEALDV